MIKKWNAVCSWMLTLFLLGHMLTMSIPMLTGGQDYSDCQDTRRRDCGDSFDSCSSLYCKLLSKTWNT